MIKLLAALEPIIEAELFEANCNYPLFASRHEGAAIIHEEVDEARDAFQEVQSCYTSLWHDVKLDNYMYITEDINKLRDAAKNLAGEAVQVAAMCDKWKMGEGSW